jgi:hypothetical protein
MKGVYFFVVFFLIFASAMFLIPTPMFPGDTVLAMTPLAFSEYVNYLGAIINGVVYGFVAWAIFMLTMGRIENKPSKDSSKNHNRKNRRTH